MSGASGALTGRRMRLAGWTGAAFALVALAVPWFLWGDATVVAGLPLWLWWHVGWMALASVVFYAFTKRAWGIGIVQTDDGPDGTAGPGRPVDGEDDAEVSRSG